MSAADHTALLACSSFRDYLAAAQAAMHTELPVFWLDEKLHRDPALMRQAIEKTLLRIPDEIDTVLVCMGFCGGSWAGIRARQRIVMPRADDCVSILLHTPQRSGYNLKERGHLYIKGPDPRGASFKGIFDRMTADTSPQQRRLYHERWKASYCSVDVIDTGVYDCRSESYLQAARDDSAFLEAASAVVPGSNLLPEALVSGQWDGRFRIFAPHEEITEEKLKGGER